MTEQTLTNRLKSLLESEREALLEGDFDRLARRAEWAGEVSDE